MSNNKKIQKMKFDAELLAAGVKPTDLKNERDTASSEKLANICLTLSIIGLVSKLLVPLGGIFSTLSAFISSLASIASVVLSFIGIIVIYVYHKKYGLDIRRQILELVLAMILGSLNFLIQFIH